MAPATEAMSAQTGDAAYFDLYWRDRFDPAAFERRVRTLQKNYAAWLPPRREARIVEIGPGFGEMMRCLAERGYTAVQALDNDAALVAALHALDNDAALVAALHARGLAAATYVDDAVFSKSGLSLKQPELAARSASIRCRRRPV
jgi:trans-aconitate methyltransferase